MTGVDHVKCRKPPPTPRSANPNWGTRAWSQCLDAATLARLGICRYTFSQSLHRRRVCSRYSLRRAKRRLAKRYREGFLIAAHMEWLGGAKRPWTPALASPIGFGRDTRSAAILSRVSAAQLPWSHSKNEASAKDQLVSLAYASGLVSAVTACSITLTGSCT